MEIIESSPTGFTCKIPERIYILDDFFDTSIIQALYNELTFQENFWGQSFLKVDIVVPNREDHLFLTHKFISNESPFCYVVEDIDTRIREIFGDIGLNLEIKGAPWMWNQGIGDFVPLHLDTHDSLDGKHTLRHWIAIVYLNTFEEGWGGETIFHLTEFQKIVARPKMGRLVLFKADTQHSTTCISRYALNRRIMLNLAYVSPNI